jgi:hypothetical protein
MYDAEVGATRLFEDAGGWSLDALLARRLSGPDGAGCR